MDNAMKTENRHDDERSSSRISITSVIVCVGVLAMAIVNQYLSQG
jgi:hypothetical protein